MLQQVAGSLKVSLISSPIGHQLVVHTTHDTAQDYQIQHVVPKWPFLRSSTVVAVFTTSAVDCWPQLLLLTLGSVACCAGDSEGGSAGGNSTAHHQGPGRLPSAHSCHTLQELCKAQVSLSVLIVPAVLHDLDQLHAHTVHSQHPEADMLFRRCLTIVSCMCRLPHLNASCTAF